MATISIQNVSKAYAKQATIHDVSVEVPDGAFVVLVGPSGCGKSTLLRMIAGLEEIDGGTISIDGDVINDVEPKHRDIAMVFQNYALYPHMTIAQNMGFSLRLSRTPKGEIDQRVNDAASILGLSDYLHRYPKQLSGGQRQRVAMGRAIVRDPRVFLFDEPLSNLDAKLRVQMRAELRALHRRLQTTILYVTHDQIEAMTMANLIVVMRDGRVEQAGTPLELYDRPINRFVAGFIGSPSMNFLDGDLTNDAQGAVFTTIDGQALRLHLSFAASEMPESVELGVRPEQFSLVDPDAPGALVLRVGTVEQTGAETHLGGTVGATELVVVLHDRCDVRPGDTVALGIDPGAGRLFDPATGTALAEAVLSVDSPIVT